MRARVLIGSIVFFAVLGCGAEKIAAPDASPSYVAQFDGLWAKYDTIYPYFDYKKINWDSLRDVYRPQAASATTEGQLVGVVVRMLAPLRDEHVWIQGPSGTVTVPYQGTAFVNWNQSTWIANASRYNFRARNSVVGYAELDSVPYIFIGSWDDADVSFTAIDSIIGLFPNAPAYIFDVRANPGGDTLPAFGVAERFYDTPRVGEYTSRRIGPQHSDLSVPSSRILTPRGAKPLTQPVLILIGRGSASAAEEFVSAMQVLPNVTLAGDTTAGAAGYPILETLGDGWSYTLPTTMVLTASNQVIEWNGIAPSVYVRTTPADFVAGADPVFEYAVQWAMSHSVAAAVAAR